LAQQGRVTDRQSLAETNGAIGVRQAGALDGRHRIDSTAAISG
jgi:hypothetical protein